MTSHSSLHLREWALGLIAILLFFPAGIAGAYDDSFASIQTGTTDHGNSALTMVLLAAILAGVVFTVWKRRKPLDQPLALGDREALEIYRGMFGWLPSYLHWYRGYFDDLLDGWLRDNFVVIEQGERNGYPLLVMSKKGGDVRVALDLGPARVWAVQP